jgi:hypothetical protein
MGAFEPPAIAYLPLVVLAVAQWLAALKAVRAPAPGRKLLWALVCAACWVGLVLGPALVLIFTGLGWGLGR